VERLEHWLTDPDEEHFSYAVSAAAALPFVTDGGRDGLIALALDHRGADVQLEGAWAAAMLGRAAGIEWLSRACLDVNRAEKAQRYLTELDRADAIPVEVGDPGFKAMAEFSQWLAHPSELGRAPDELRIIDHRELAWPPARKRIPLWLIEYRVKDTTGLADDDVGIGLVGSVTFCFFSYGLTQRPPEDAYAIHCYWEMEHEALISEMDVEPESSEYRPMLRQCTLEGIDQATIVAVAEISPKLKYPRRLVGLAQAIREGNAGWIVLDGARSRWYGRPEMPAGTLDKTVLAIHVGRELLGLREEVDRLPFP
jgi:hypothetical protein